MRRILSNILLLLFRYHPNGVLEMELSRFYQQMFNEEVVYVHAYNFIYTAKTTKKSILYISYSLTMDLKYLLCVHKSILITNTKERGQLYTLNDRYVSVDIHSLTGLLTN